MSAASAYITALAFVYVHLLSLVSAGTRQPSTWHPGRHLLCACPRIYQPVCGSDGKQYPNRCTAECAGVFVTDQNPRSASQCARIAVDPVGPSGPGNSVPQLPVPTNGGNSSSSSSNNRPITAAGVLGLGPRPLNMNTMNGLNGASAGSGCRCPRIYLPVCGSDGKLYSNKCLLECAGATATGAQPDSSRNCPSSGSSGGRRLLACTPVNQPACACTREYSPVCGSNGRKYNNDCLAKCEGVTVTGAATGDGSNCQASQLPTASGPSQTSQSGPNLGPNLGSSQSRPTVITQQPGPGQSGPGPATVGQLVSGPANPRQPSGGQGFSCGCEIVYAPVCGKDARWYPNACSAQCAGVALSAVRPDVYGNCLMV